MSGAGRTIPLGGLLSGRMDIQVVEMATVYVLKKENGGMMSHVPKIMDPFVRWNIKLRWDPKY